MSSERAAPRGIVRFVVWCLPLVGLGLAALIIEVSFRLLTPAVKPRLDRDRPYGYFMPADAITLQDEAPHAKADGTYRIAVVGDSFTFGPYLQVEDTFPKRLERWLNLQGEPAKRVEVLNRGFSGSSLADHVSNVRNTLRANPDLLILQITLNDAEPRPLTKEEKRALFDAPYLGSPVFKVWSSLGFLLSRLHNSSTHRAYVDYHTKFFKAPETFKIFDAALTKIGEVTSAAGVPLVAVVFPMFDFPFDDKYPFAEVHSIIAAALGAQGIRHLDLRRAYTGISPERLQVIPVVDNHPNEIAHRIAAEGILAYLVAEGLVPDWSVPRRVFRLRKDLRSKRVNPTTLFSKAAERIQSDARATTPNWKGRRRGEPHD